MLGRWHILPVLFLILNFYKGYTQCEPPSSIKATYCEGQLAEILMDDPDPNVRYAWYSIYDQPIPSYGTEGRGRRFLSPGIQTGPATFYYQKEVTMKTGPDYRIPSGGQAVPNNGVNSYQMPVDVDVSFRLNSYTVVVRMNDPNETYGFGLRYHDGTDTTYAEWFTGRRSDFVSVGSGYYRVEIPADFIIPAGAGFLEFISADDEGENYIGVEEIYWYSGSSYTGGTYAANSIEVGNPAKTIGTSNLSPLLMDWDITLLCDKVGVTTQLSDNCCIPVGPAVTLSATTLTPTSADFPVTLTVSGADISNAMFYYWYDENNTLIDNGLGRTSIQVNTVGQYTVRVVREAGDQTKAACYANRSVTLGIKSIFAPADFTICLGDPVTLKGEGAEGKYNWYSDDADADDYIVTKNAQETDVYILEPGEYTYMVEGEVKLGNIAKDGKFEFFNLEDNYDPLQPNRIFETAYGIAQGPDESGRQGHYITGEGQFRVDDVIRGYSANSYQCRTVDDYWVKTDPVTGDVVSRGKIFIADAVANRAGTPFTAAFANTYPLWRLSDQPIEPGQTYEFSMDISNWNDGATPPNIMLLVNGVPLDNLQINGVPVSGDYYAFPASKFCQWETIVGTWTAPPGVTTATIAVAEVSNTLMGYEFAMDDITFSTGRGMQRDEVTIKVEDCNELEAREDGSVCVGEPFELYTVKNNGFIAHWKDSKGNIVAETERASVYPVSNETYTVTARYPLINFIKNGTFESGSLDFTTTLRDLSTTTNSSIEQGDFLVATGSSTYLHSTMLKNQPDHTLGSLTGRMMLIRFKKDDVLVGKTIPVESGRSYVFSTWLKHFHVGGANAREYTFDLLVNGVVQETMKLAPGTDWTQFSYTWTAQTSGNVAISFVARTDHWESGLAMDDISLARLGPEKTDEVKVTVDMCNTLTLKDEDCDDGDRLISYETDGIFKGWYDSEGNLVSRDDTLRVQPSARTQYSAIVSAGLGPVNENGNMNLGLVGMEQLFSKQPQNPADNQPLRAPNYGFVGNANEFNGNHYAPLTGRGGSGKFLLVNTDQNRTNERLFVSKPVPVEAGKEYNLALSLAYATKLTELVKFTEFYPIEVFIGGVKIASIDLEVDNSWQDFLLPYSPATTGNVQIEIVITAKQRNNYLDAMQYFAFAVDEVHLRPLVDVLTESIEVDPCFSCNAPVTLSFPEDTLNLCLGDALELSFSLDTANGPALFGYYYTWSRDRAALASHPTALLPADSDNWIYSVSSVTQVDSAWHYIRIEDGNNGFEHCYLEDSVLVVVHGKPLPELMSEDLDAMCEGESRHIRVKDALSTSKYNYRLEDANGATLTLFPEDDSVNVTAGTGGFDLWLIEETAFGCKDSVVYPIAVDRLPTEALITTVIPDTLAFCASENPKNIIGNVPTIGIGEWTSDDAAYGFGDPSSATTTLTGLNGDAEFKISWTISNGVCPPSSDTVVVIGTDFVKPGVSLTVDAAAICEGTEIKFKAKEVNGGDNPLYTFYASDGSILQAQSTSDEYVVSSPTEDLEVYVELVSNSTCLSSDPDSDKAESAIVTVQVDTRPSAVSLPGDTTVCSDKVNLTVTLSGSEGTGGWGVINSVIGSFTDPTANPGEFVFNSEGETEVYYVNTSQRGHCPEEGDTITVKKTGNLTSAEPGPDIEVCVDEPVELNGNDVDLANEHVWWEALGTDKSNPDASGIVMTFPLPLGPTDSSKAEVTSFPALSAGVAEIDYYFVYHIRSRHGDCVSRDTLAVRILNTPNQPGPISGETEICSGSSSTYGVAAVPGATEGYEWSFAPAGLARVVSGGTSNGVSIIFDENGTVSSPTVVEIIVKAKNQCDTGPERRLSVTINPQVTPVLSLSQSSPSVCAGDAMTFTATVSGHTPGDAYYQWYHGSSALAGATTSTLMLDNLVNGDEVRVVVFVTNECAVTPQLSESVQVVVTDTVPVRVSLDADDYEPCDGQTVVFTATGQPGSGGSYSWYHNGTLQASASASASFVMNGAGTEDSVRVVYTYNGACPGPSNPASASLVLTPTDLVPVAVSLDAAGPICFDQSAETFTATKVHSEPGNSGSYRWRIGTGAYVSGSSTYTMPFLQPGVYTVEVEFTSGLKCVVDRTVTDQATYEVLALPAPAISGGTVYCPGEAITLTGIPTNIGSTFSWSYINESGASTPLGSALTESAANEGLYVFLERDPNGCEGRARQIVEEFDTDVEITATPGTMKCEGDSVYLSTRLATTYTWTLDGNATSFTDRNIWVIEPGEYEVTLVLNSSSTQCTGYGAITIVDKPRPEPVILEPGDTICETEGYVLNVSDMANLSNPTISWYVMGESGMIGSTSELAVSSSGQYYAVMSHDGCPRSSDTVEVIADRAVKAVVQPREQYIEEGEIAGLSGLSSVNAYTYAWSSIQYEGIYSPDERSGFIQVQPRESMNVFVLEVKGEYGKCVSRDSGYVFVEKDVRPWNSFSPNGDGVYDEWIIEGLSTYPNALVEVYNRWGTLVWRSEGYEQPWRGENFRNGQPLPVATYYYVIYPNGGKVKKPRTGDITIVR